MKTDVSERLKRYLLGAKVKSMTSLLALLKSDLRKMLSDYMSLTGEMTVTADINDEGSEVLFHIDFRADEVYDAGELMETDSI